MDRSRFVASRQKCVWSTLQRLTNIWWLLGLNWHFTHLSFQPGFDVVRCLLPEATPNGGRRAWLLRLRSRFCDRAGVLALGAARPWAPAASWGLTCLPFPGVGVSETVMADAWEEIRRLAADFQRAQFAEAAQRCWSPPVWSRLRPGTLPRSRSGRRASAVSPGPAAVAAGRGARSPA